MLISAHQPHFMPWLGYFDKIRRSDLFCIVDHVQFERQNFQNRNRIESQGRVQWLIVPVIQRSRHERIVDKQINPARDGRITWEQKLIRSLHHAYCRAPHYQRYRRDLEDLLCAEWTHLADLDIALLRYFLAALEIDTPLVRTSELEGIEGARTEMIVSMCRAVGATGYLSGRGGSTRYLERERFAEAGLELRWQEFEHPTYPQFPGSTFTSRLSVVDLLVHCGPEAAAILRGGRSSAPVITAQPPAPVQELGL